MYDISSSPGANIAPTTNSKDGKKPNFREPESNKLELQESEFCTRNTWVRYQEKLCILLNDIDKKDKKRREKKKERTKAIPL